MHSPWPRFFRYCMDGLSFSALALKKLLLWMWQDIQTYEKVLWYPISTDATPSSATPSAININSYHHPLLHAAPHNRRLPGAMRGGDEAHRISRVLQELLLKQGHSSVFYRNFSGWWGMASETTVHLLRWERRPRTHPYHFFVYCLVAHILCPYVAW